MDHADGDKDTSSKERPCVVVVGANIASNDSNEDADRYYDLPDAPSDRTAAPITAACCPYGSHQPYLP